MKTIRITAVRANNSRRVWEVESPRGDFTFPYAAADTVPTAEDPIVELWIDPELACEGFTYRLASGAEDSLVLDNVLSYNRDPAYMRDMLLFQLTCQALDALETTPLSRREIIRRLRTSPAQFYRLIDTTNHSKSVDKMLELLQVLGCEVEFTVTQRPLGGTDRDGSEERAG